MEQRENARMLSLRFAGEAIRDHSVSVSLFAKKVSSVQNLLIHLAESRLEKQPRERRSAAIAAECELFLRPIRAASVVVELALPRREETLFPELPDLSELALADARDILGYYSRGEYEPIIHVCPNPIRRKRVLKDLSLLAPSEKSDYSLTFKGNDGADHVLASPGRQELKKMLEDADLAVPAVLEAPRFVEAKGMAVVRGSEIVSWKETYDILELDLEAAWRPKRITWQDCHLELRHPIAVTLEEQDKDFWVATHDNLGISTAGASEDEAREAFSEELVVLWWEIAQEPDERLTPDAIGLKQKLLDLVVQPTLL